MHNFFKQAGFLLARVELDDRAYATYSIFLAAFVFILLFMWALLLLDFMPVLWP